MYTIKSTGEKFDSFFAAIEAANAIRSEIYDRDGVRRWAPAPVVSAKRMRHYLEQKAAYEAQQRMRATRA